MFINAHCHVFNMQAIYSSVSLDILEYRLEDTPLRDWVQRSLLNMVNAYVEGQEPSRFVKFLCSVFGANKFRKVNLAKSMDEVASILMRDTEKALDPGTDIVLVPLMMDILPEPVQDPSHFDKLFRDQINDTIRQSLLYPGHILPFVAVNPKRSEALFGEKGSMLHLLEEAIEEHGFVGVKLYPTLGYTVEDLEACGNGKFFEYVSNNQLPITMHTNPGGSRHELGPWQNCQPNKWTKYLTNYPGFRINFGHFGGGFCFRDDKDNPHALHAEWRKQIFTLMNDFPGRVFADFSYHDQPWTRRKSAGYYPHPVRRNMKENRADYFEALNKAVDDPITGPGILFGTDFPLTLAMTEEDEYIKVFRQGLGAQRFRKVSDDNPRKFLGMGDGTDAKPHKGNIRHHIDILKGKKQQALADHVWAEGRPPAAWLGPV